MKRNRITFLIAELILVAIAGIFINRIFREDNPQKRVAVILPDSGNTRWEGLVNGLKQSAQVNNIHLIICNTDEIVSADDEKELIDEQLENDVDAFIICPAPGEDTSDMLGQLGDVPFVLITQDAYSEDAVPSGGQPHGAGRADAAEFPLPCLQGVPRFLMRRAISSLPA